LKRSGSLVFAFIGSIWYWTFAPIFSYTFNHDGVIPFVLASFYFLIRFYSSRRTIDLLIAIMLTAVCSLVKLNFGLVSFVGVMGIVFYLRKEVSESAMMLWLVSLFVVPLFAAGMYALFLRGLSPAEIRQCMPFLGSDRPIHTSMIELMGGFSLAVLRNMIATPASLFFSLLVNFSFVQCVLRTRKASPDEVRAVWVPLVMALIFLALMFHEYFLSGVAYRAFWIFPFTNLLIFMLVARAFQEISTVIKILLYGALFGIIGIEMININTIVHQLRIPHQQISYLNGQIYTANSQDWRQSVFSTVNYLKSHLKDGETFLAVPYDPLYYYLTETRSPTRMTIFFEHIHITPQQEDEIIFDLEQQNTQFIVLSRRSFSNKEWLGFLGKDYGKRLYAYIMENFSLVANFGDWNQEAGAIEPHAVRIYKRKAIILK
jgi:hypothetical protein